MQANLLNEKLDALKREQEVYHFGLAVFIQRDMNKGMVVKIVCKHNCEPLPQEVHINSATIFYSPRRIQECFNCLCSVIRFSEGTTTNSG